MNSCFENPADRFQSKIQQNTFLKVSGSAGKSNMTTRKDLNSNVSGKTEQEKVYNKVKK